MPPEHPPVVLDFCGEKFKQLDNHVEESVPIRDKVTKHEEKLETIEKGIDRIIRGLWGSVAAIVLTILLATLGLAVTWGRTLEKVERLDKMHNTDKQISVSLGDK
ncbi:MAG: hypothetical protein NTZ48_07110 [Candidatus Omnitrophica bacterium]|nr:hypothetical protein [Candidatus Omnitrophota bacterium]